MAGVTAGRPVFLRPRTGIALGLYPSSDPTCDLELQRADPGSTVTFTPIVRLGVGSGQGAMQYVDQMPQDNLKRFYRLRSGQDDLAASAFTNSVSAKPIVIPNGPIATPPLSGGKIGVSAWFSSLANINIGSQGATGSFKKTLRFGAISFIPSALGTKWSYGIGTLVPGSSANAFNYRCQYPLPIGAIVYRLAMAFQRTLVASTCTLKLYSISTGGVATLQATLTGGAAAGNQVISTSSIMIAISAADYLIADLKMKAANAGGNDATLIYTELSYKVGNYLTSY